MSHIVQFPTKKAFRAAVEGGSVVHMENPSHGIFPNQHHYYACGGLLFLEDRKGNPAADAIPAEPTVFTATNHPKRSWFAEVKWDGKSLTIR